MEKAKSGQFLNLQVKGESAPLLRKPLAIYKQDANTVEVLYRVVGQGTKLLSEYKPAETISVLGPLGNGFPLFDKPAFIVGGGIGIPPIYSLAKAIGANKGTIALLGFKTADELAICDGFEDYIDQLIITTDDGSYGIKGNIIEGLNSLDPATLPKIGYGCGPTPMLKGLKTWASSQETSLYLSVEKYMGCGIGVCAGCSIKATKNGYYKVCKDGPIFNALDIEL